MRTRGSQSFTTQKKAVLFFCWLRGVCDSPSIVAVPARAPPLPRILFPQSSWCDCGMDCRLRTYSALLCARLTWVGGAALSSRTIEQQTRAWHRVDGRMPRWNRPGNVTSCPGADAMRPGTTDATGWPMVAMRAAVCSSPEPGPKEESDAPATAASNPSSPEPKALLRRQEKPYRRQSTLKSVRSRGLIVL